MNDEQIIPDGAAAVSHTERSEALFPTWWIRLLVIWCGIVLPVACHVLFELALGLDVLFDEAWQDGLLSTQLQYSLALECCWPLALLLTYAAVCLKSLAWNARLVASPWVRAGVFVGAVTTMTYAALLSISFGFPPLICLFYLFASVASGAVNVGLFLGLNVMAGERLERAMVVLGGAVGLLLLGVVVAAVTQEEVFALPAACLLVINVLAAPIWSTIAYWYTLLRILKTFPDSRRFGLGSVFSLMFWLAAHMAAVRYTIVRSLEEYAQLPLEEPPKCYIATAAARGHASLVGSSPVVTSRGDIWLANRQLATLKAAEILFATLSPRVHRLVRRFYDWAGPQAARFLQSPWAADAAYALLKPVEWCMASLLCLLLPPERRALAANLYQLRMDAAANPCNNLGETENEHNAQPSNQRARESTNTATDHFVKY